MTNMDEYVSLSFATNYISPSSLSAPSSIEREDQGASGEVLVSVGSSKERGNQGHPVFQIPLRSTYTQPPLATKCAPAFRLSTILEGKQESSFQHQKRKHQVELIEV